MGSPTRREVAVAVAASRCALFLLLGISAPWSLADAQALWLDREDRDVVFLEVYKPQFEGGGQPFAASGMLLGARKVLAGGRLALVTDVPVAHARRWEYSVQAIPSGTDTLYRGFLSPGEPATEIGNPYVGVEFPGDWTHELGIRIQSSNRGGVLYAGGAAELERLAFADQTTTVQYGLAYRPPPGPGRHWRWRFAFLVPMENSATYVISYRGMVLLDRPRYRLGGGLAGLANVDPRSFGTFDTRTAHQLEGMAEVLLGAWRPALHLRRWLDENARDAVPFVIGLRLEWRPPSRSTQDSN